MMGNHHTPWAEQDGDGMWEPSCRICGVLGGPPFEMVLQRFNTEEEAYSAANSVLSMLPPECPKFHADEEGTTRRETLLMDSQRAWLRRVKGDLAWVVAVGTSISMMWLIVITETIGWNGVTVGLMGSVVTVPLLGLMIRRTINERLREVDRQ
jgi:hypothetical protein